MYVCTYVRTYVCMYVGWMVCVMDVGCYVAVPRSYLHRPLLPRYKIISGTCTGSWCYEYVNYMTFYRARAGSWCNVRKRLSDLLSYFHRRLMLRYAILSCKCASTSCCVHLRSKTFRFTCAVAWWSLKGSSLVLAHTHTHLVLHK